MIDLSWPPCHIEALYGASKPSYLFSWATPLVPDENAVEPSYRRTEHGCLPQMPSRNKMYKHDEEISF